ncbi:MAG: hypothetical protein IPI46_12090 [Bacteroidetes bacterium]|nr:hypothetical protein [Bacteroidota bacterium]
MKQKFTWQTLNRLRVFCLTLLVSMASIGAIAQTTIATTLANNNGQSGVCFNLYNSNAYAININAIQCAAGLTGTQTVELWTKPVAGNNQGLPGAISVVNGWTQQASQTVATTQDLVNTGAACQTVLSGMNVSLAANSYYLVFLKMELRYSTVGTQTCLFSGGGVSINSCALNGYGGPITGPTFNPRGLVGAITFSAALPCSGTPAPGNTVASASSVCTGINVNLSLQNPTIGTGVSHQWFNNAGLIAGATNSTYSQAITSPENFYCNVTCDNGGSPITTASTPVAVGLTTGSACLTYCSSVSSNTADEEIYQVTLNGSSTNPLYANGNGCTTPAPGAGSLLSRYSNFRTLGPLTTVMQGATVPLEVRQNECDGPTLYAAGIGAWIDFNQNGLFTDPGEAVYIESTSTAATGASPGGDKVISSLVTIPIGATPGSTVMRVICAEGYSGASLTPCLNYGYGETEDFLIDITVAPPCSGIPNPGNTIASNINPCPGTTVNFSLQNTTVGTGVSYQWYNNSGLIPGATTAFYSQIATVADDVYCDVTCGSSTTTSNLVSYTINNYVNCYCTPTHSFGTSGSFYGQINNVTFDAINNTSTSPVTAPYYTNYAPGAGTTATIYTGTSIPLSVTIGSYGYAVAWIDWDQSGSFDASEYTYLGVENVGVPATFTTLIPVPLTATPGITKIRVRSEAYFNAAPSATQSCANLNYGESEDYTLTVVIPSPCAGAPAPGNTLASATSVCPGTNVNFSLQNATIGIGVTYQWYNNSGLIAGATNSYYSQVVSIADDFYCDVTCSNLGSPITTASNLVSIAMNPAIFCYCSTGLGGSCGINSCSSVEVVGTTLNNITGPGACTNTYSQFPQSGSTTALLIPGASYTVNIGTPSASSTSQGAVWIDYNQNGIFEASEFTFISNNILAGSTAGGTVIIPVTATSGSTGMRVRTDWAGTTLLTATDACTTRTWVKRKIILSRSLHYQQHQMHLYKQIHQTVQQVAI